jgi:putative ABC transport system ATP-binding protein
MSETGSLAVVSTATRAAVTADVISKRYGAGAAAVVAVEEVSVRIPEASYTAIMGASGSGKSTLLHCLSGLDTVDSGRVLLGDVDITAMGERELTRLRREHVGFVFQAFNLLPSLSARENIVLPLQLAGAAVDTGHFESVVDLLGLGDRLAHRPAELSGGQIQRVAVARALITRPRVVFADEPTGNLDRRSGNELLGLLRRCVDEMGQTVVMVTHDASAAARADRVLMLADGRIADDLAAPSPAAILERLDVLEGNG